MTDKNLENELREILLEAHNVTQRDKVIAWVGGHDKKFTCLLKLFLANEYRITQRAAWPIGFIAEQHPKLLKKHVAAIVKNLQKPGLHQAVKRNSLRMLQNIDVTEELQGILMDACLRFIEDVQEPVAVKAFALTNLQKLSQQYPEILPEIRLLIEAQLPNQTAAFKVRARPFLLDNT